MNRFATLGRLLFATGLLATASCKGFVDLTPDNVAPVSNFYRTESDMSQALTGTYGNLRGIYNGYYQYTELPSDNARTYSESEAAGGVFDKLTWNSSTGSIQGAWNDGYRTIANANVVLGRLDGVTFVNAATKAQYAAEAKFLRALMYFNLVRFFGDVPLVLTELKTETEAYSYSRTPAADVYAQIEKDLLEAEPDLPAQYPPAGTGRATRGAAKALLGKVYLQEKKWAQAQAKLAEVVTSGTYRLLPDINNVFGLGHDNNAEIIFAAQYVSGGFGEGNAFVHQMAPQPSGTSITFVTGNSSCEGTLDLYNAFETGDVRKNAFIGVFAYGNDPYYWPRKFVYPVTVLGEGENDWPILRYADVLLMYAEALNNAGKTADALTQLNLVRTRASLAPRTGLSAADTQLAIEQERRVELCFEGHRWHDLIRWGKDLATMQAFKAKYTSYDRANANLNPRPEERLYPIPSREIALNPNLTQNPGY